MKYRSKVYGLQTELELNFGLKIPTDMSNNIIHLGKTAEQCEKLYDIYVNFLEQLTKELESNYDT